MRGRKNMERVGTMIQSVRSLTNGWVAEVEPVDAKHSEEKRECDCNTIVVARDTATQLPVGTTTMMK